MEGPRRRTLTTRSVMPAALLLALVGACQSILGFKEFSGGSGSDSGSDAAGSVAPDSGGEGGCSSPVVPEDAGMSPALVKVERGNGECLSIDRTEVTRRQYQTFLDSNPKTLVQAEFCTWNVDFAPSNCASGGGISINQEPDAPVVCVNFCDAAAFCSWSHKRLCKGKWGGTYVADAANSEWYAACSSGGANQYPYGNDYQVGVCNDASRQDTGCTSGSCTTVKAGSLTGCVAAGGAADLAGNVSEWVDECDGNQGEVDNCHVRGGGVNSPASVANCSVVSDQKRGFVHAALGFRCCE